MCYHKKSTILAPLLFHCPWVVKPNYFIITCRLFALESRQLLNGFANQLECVVCGVICPILIFLLQFVLFEYCLVLFGTLYKLNYLKDNNIKTKEDLALVYNFTIISMDKRSITCVLHADFTKIHFHKLTSTILIISFMSSWYQDLVKSGLPFKYFIFKIFTLYFSVNFADLSSFVRTNRYA